ncbi:disintegrin and metalloproteinase domain-containing protein 8 isoform X3 [Ochotona curzoniae]|uniref:disintegrin and metalloproteinase domain-containing protein 8 isoform X3 n=1 Tax=Ochotona curzoniae TaxID=130825 RepID=UPI001B3491C1|nr:disintegrin and metalloproteinase domain-containing protein 8 isoform X3 [Ochotona curzoniae]
MGGGRSGSAQFLLGCNPVVTQRRGTGWGHQCRGHVPLTTSPSATALAAPRLPTQPYQVVWPQRLPGSRARRALPSNSGQYPEDVSYVLQARGLSFTLHLRKNRDLLSPGYTETYTGADGVEVTEQLQQDHCLYQGHVEGQPVSAASLSTCNGLRGFFRVGSAVHLIEPLDGAEDGRHALYLAEHLLPTTGTCGVSNSSLDSLQGPRVSAAFRPRNWPLARETRYVELYVVTDTAEFRKWGSRKAVQKRVLEAVNHVDQLYQALNMRVVLVGLEMWDRLDAFHVSPEAERTLDALLGWRAHHLLGKQPHDNVQLITGVDFSGTTVGLAKVSAMCSRSSGAVNQDHSPNPLGVASTMAHELGHNLGMDHDENVQGCHCPAPSGTGGCIMASSISSRFPRMFSGCSRTHLETFLDGPQTDCLANVPDPRRLVGGPTCGNHFVEPGEQCDCGPAQACRNPCCNATTCQLAEGAVCAHGACCHACQVRPAGELCRPAKDACDLEELCDGQEHECPEDSFRENGTPCPEGFCYKGTCPSLTQRCQELWGPGARVAMNTCFTYSISPSCQGSIPIGLGRADRCGILFCEGGLEPPLRRYCTITSSVATCQALFTDSNMAFEAVPSGTKCGPSQVCWDGRCQGLDVYRSRNCSAKCHGHGVCNHKRECHCLAGWAPPYCAERLAPGPVAPSRLPFGGLVAVVVLAVVLVAVAAAIIYRKAQSCGHGRSPASKASMGMPNPLFRLGGEALAPTPHLPASPNLPSRLPSPSSSTGTPAKTTISYELRPAPPAKPLVKPRQVIKPSSAPPVPPAKPRPGAADPAVTQRTAGLPVAPKPPGQRW